MKLYNVECFGTEFAMYLENAYSKIENVQIDVLSRYMTDNPFLENDTKKLIKKLFDYGMITKDDLEKAVPFSKIKEKQKRNKMNAHE